MTSHIADEDEETHRHRNVTTTKTRRHKDITKYRTRWSRRSRCRSDRHHCCFGCSLRKRLCAFAPLRWSAMESASICAICGQPCDGAMQSVSSVW